MEAQSRLAARLFPGSDWGGADARAHFRIDQFLIQRFGRAVDAVGDIGEFELSQQVEQGRLV